MLVSSDAEVDVGVWLEVVAQAGGEVRTYSIDGGTLRGGASSEVEIPDVADLDSMEWSGWGVHLSVRATVVDAASGRALWFASAHDRVVWFADGAWSLKSPDDVLPLLALEVDAIRTEEGTQLEGIEPGASMSQEVW